MNESSAPAGRPQPLFASHEWVYSRKVKGTFRTLKWTLLWLLLGFYYVAPWFRWERGEGAPDQAFLIDMASRRAYFLWIEIWPQEVYYLVGLLIIGAIGLFFVTALAGRVWCGFFCPQTVWTDLFLWAETLIEGDRNARMRIDRAPLSLDKAFRKVAKHGVWLFISAATGGAWILYFGDAYEVLPEVFTGRASPTVYFLIGLFTTTTYLLAGWAREQVCIYMCPWPRFQAAMFDEDSLIVTYEAWRGEPRGKAKTGQSFEGRGDCVDCTLCHQVCPTGVDIRKGQQLACIGCALCIDACAGVMDRVGLPRGLITYDSIANQIARQKGEPSTLRPVRPRTIAYVAILALVVAVMTFSMATRSRVEINVLKDRAPLFVRLTDGSIRNSYTYKVLNMERQAKTFELSIDGIENAQLRVIGSEDEWTDLAKLPVKPDAVGSFRVLVRADRARLDGKSSDLTLVLEDKSNGAVHEYDAAFSGPAR